MPSVITAVPSDSHKANIKWEMKIDKLTLLHDLPEQWKEGMVTTMIDLVTDTSNQGKYGIARSYSPGCRGYEVSMEGRVPLSQSPLIWSPKTAYLLQVKPKKGKKPWLRLDLNPDALTPSGMVHLCDMLQHIFGVPWPTWRFARVSRIDVAIDLWGVSLTDWVWDLPKRSAREVICRQQEVRTVYLGAKRASPLVIYNKGKQNPHMAAGGALTRVEYRAKYTGPVLDLLTLVNPLREVIVLDPMKLAHPYPAPLKAALRAVGHLHGLKSILRTFPNSQREIIKHGLAEAKAVWWKPLEIWEHWGECLKTTLSSMFDVQGDKLGVAAAYAQAMEFQADPVTGELPFKQLPVGSVFSLPANHGL